jgi:hypothetical protein
MREVSNFHRKNLIETGEVPEFWTAKMATKMIIKKATQKEIFIVLDSFLCDGRRSGAFPFSLISKSNRYLGPSLSVLEWMKSPTMLP